MIFKSTSISKIPITLLPPPVNAFNMTLHKNNDITFVPWN